MNIIESISGNGVKTTHHSLFAIRLTRPKSGDIVDLGENAGNYPFTHGQYGRIEDVETGFANKGEAHICCQLGSAFLTDDGRVSISGGPFTVIKLDDLEPMMRTYRARFWNWGDRTAEAGNGVDYWIDRPLFKLKKIEDAAKRYMQFMIGKRMRK